MNSFIVHAARGKESGKYNISLLEVAPKAQGFTTLRKNIDGILVLKQWRNVYVGKTDKAAGNIAKAEAKAIIAALEAAGFETAKPLYVAGVFNQPHPDILKILTTAKEC
jgi:hypothetical protein